MEAGTGVKLLNLQNTHNFVSIMNGWSKRTVSTLLTRMSMEPKRSSELLANFSVSPTLVTSQGTKWACPSNSSISCATCRPVSFLRSATIVLTPSCASCRPHRQSTARVDRYVFAQDQQPLHTPRRRQFRPRRACDLKLCIDEGQSIFDPSVPMPQTSGTRFSMTSISSSR